MDDGERSERLPHRHVVKFVSLTISLFFISLVFIALVFGSVRIATDSSVPIAPWRRAMACIEDMPDHGRACSRQRTDALLFAASRCFH